MARKVTSVDFSAMNDVTHCKFAQKEVQPKLYEKQGRYIYQHRHKFLSHAAVLTINKYVKMLDAKHENKHTIIMKYRKLKEPSTLRVLLSNIMMFRYLYNVIVCSKPSFSDTSDFHTISVLLISMSTFFWKRSSSWSSDDTALQLSLHALESNESCYRKENNKQESKLPTEEKRHIKIPGQVYRAKHNKITLLRISIKDQQTRTRIIITNIK